MASQNLTLGYPLWGGLESIKVLARDLVSTLELDSYTDDFPDFADCGATFRLARPGPILGNLLEEVLIATRIVSIKNRL